MLIKFLMALITVLSFVTSSAEFPHRGEYPDVKTITLSELAERNEQINVVDVRSKLEFDVLHIEGAVHITLSNKGFEDKVKQLANNGKAIAFYCNGITCTKSYEAAQRASNSGLENLVAYDEGVLAWAIAYPQKSILLGSKMKDSSQLISKEDFAARLLPAKEFEAMFGDKDVMIIDVRDPTQIDARLFKDYPVRNIPVDRFDSFLREQNPSTKLMIFDAVGKQIEWLQYHLRKQSHTNYYFLEGGASGYLKSK